MSLLTLFFFFKKKKIIKYIYLFMLVEGVGEKEAQREKSKEQSCRMVYIQGKDRK